MIINLFDSNFIQSACSVAYQTPRHVEYARGQMTWDGVTIFTDAWINNPAVDMVSSRYKIGWLREPYCLHPDIYEQALMNVRKFDLILTYYQPYIDRGAPFRFAPYGGVWIDRAEWGVRPKTKFCSMLIGTKMSTEGHRLRWQIAEMIDHYGFQVDFFGAKGQPVDYSQATKVKTLADYRFTIVTETCREDNLFTEWLLDCFVMGTVPIYWGCPNSSRFFNGDGIFEFETVMDVADILARVLPAPAEFQYQPTYENLGRAADYAITEDWLYQNVLREFE